jgi:two-component system response regulator
VRKETEWQSFLRHSCQSMSSAGARAADPSVGLLRDLPNRHRVIGLRSGRTILIVEDSDDDFDAVTRAFRRELAVDNPLHRCEDGRKALAYLADSLCGNATLPAVILLDLNLPGIDGRKVLEDVKNDERLRFIPVLVMTNSDAQRDVRDCYRMGANCYIRKSLDWASFVMTMAHLKKFWFDTAILPEA